MARLSDNIAHSICMEESSVKWAICNSWSGQAHAHHSSAIAAMGARGKFGTRDFACPARRLSHASRRLLSLAARCSCRPTQVAFRLHTQHFQIIILVYLASDWHTSYNRLCGKSAVCPKILARDNDITKAEYRVSKCAPPSLGPISLNSEAILIVLHFHNN